MGAQDAPKTDQDGAKARQDGAKTARDGAKTGQGGAKTAQNGAKTLQDGAETVQERQITKTLTNLRKNKVFGEALDRSGELVGMSWVVLVAFFFGRLGAIGRSLGDVLGALGGVLGALLDVLEVSWRALWAMICQDLDRNPRNTKTF